MKKSIIIFLCIITTVFTSCGYRNLVEKFAPKEESEYGRTVLELIRANDFEAVSKHLHHTLISKVTRENLEAISQLFPSGNLIQCEIIGSQVNKTNNDWNGGFTFEYEFESNKWALANIVVNRNDGTLSITGFHVAQTEQSQKEHNKFTLYGKSMVHYLFFLFTILILSFSVFTFYVCIRTPLAKRKILWAIVTLTGAISLTLNWTTGELSFQLLSIQFLTISAMTASPYAPWFISFSIPVGSILFWIKRKTITFEKTDDSNTVQDNQ